MNDFSVRGGDLDARLIDIDRLRPLGRNTRKHPPRQIEKLKASLEQFGRLGNSGRWRPVFPAARDAEDMRPAPSAGSPR